ncbi:MAG TPA: MFS transporter, partial [Actinomycetes bacterium]|nr:MFS transporter [Actinomycetes bacterium]
PAGRWVLLATVLGTGIAFLDTTVVNVALPTIGEELDAGISSLQWVVNAYTLTLSGFLLLGGSLGDHFGRRRVFVIGVVWFAVASLLCGLAPSDEALIAARALQGIGGALLTPGSLAIIEASFRREDRGPAIGAWSGLGGVAAAVGPFLGGWLVQAVSWRLIFLINLPLAAVVVWVSLRHVPETRDPSATGRLDWAGATLAAVGLAGVVYALTDGPAEGWTSPPILGAGLAGVAALAAFLAWERRTPSPMLPLDIFASRQFSAANAVTFVVYGALASSLFLLPIQLQRVVGYSPLASGVALVPVTVLMLALSARAGRLGARIGPRLPMTLGPLLVAAGFALFTRVTQGASYAMDILPASLVYGFGLVLTVAPLTATVLAAAPAEHAGVASAVNNAVARTAGLLAVAVLPVAAGISGADALEPARFADGFRAAMTIAAVLCAAGGLLSWLTIRNPEPEPEEGDHPFSCPLNAPTPAGGRP